MTRMHEPRCPMRMSGRSHDDAAHRLSDEYNLHRVADPHGSIGKWFAAALNDGRSDHVLYDNKRDCVRHQHHNEQWYVFIKIVPSTMSVCDAAIMLTVSRRTYDAGMRLTDPDDRSGGKQIIKRNSIEDMLALMQMRPINIRFRESE